MQVHLPDAALQRLLTLRDDPESQAVRNAAYDSLAEILSFDTGLEDEPL